MEPESSFYLSQVVGGDPSDTSSDDDLFDSKEIGIMSQISRSSHAARHQSASSQLSQASVQPMTTPSAHRPKRGLLSPFSPLAKSEERRADSSVSFVSSTNDNLSLSACRKVSVVVTIHTEENSETSQKVSKLCLFPLVLDTHFTPTEPLSPTSATIRQAVKESTRDLVVVNPSAFGKHIPAQFTMETARLVAEVSNIASEDWARKYYFDKVIWSHGVDDTESFGNLADSISNDAMLRQRNTVCFAMGNHKSNTIFGSRGKTRSADVPSPQSLGLLGMTFGNLLQELPQNAVCTLSLLEIPEEDSIRDMLNPDSTDSQSKLKVSYSDNRRAWVHNMVDYPLDSLVGLENLLRRAFYSQAALRIRKREGPRGHVICTLKIWQNAVQRELNSSTKCITLDFVDLCNGHDSTGMNSRGLQRMASARKSLSVLRGVLRGLILREVTGESHPLSFRESTLTKILQRTLSDEGTQAVILASVSAQSVAYERTLQTLNYVNRLLTRPGATAQSPFDRKISPDSIDSSPAAERLAQWKADEYVMKSVTSDPRQRLARLMSKSPSKPRATPQKLCLEESYKPTDYMAVDPGEDSFSPVERYQKEDSLDSGDRVRAGDKEMIFMDTDIDTLPSKGRESSMLDFPQKSPEHVHQNDPINRDFKQMKEYFQLPEMLSVQEQVFVDEIHLFDSTEQEMYSTYDNRRNEISPDASEYNPEQHVDNNALVEEWMQENLVNWSVDNVDNLNPNKVDISMRSDADKLGDVQHNEAMSGHHFDCGESTGDEQVIDEDSTVENRLHPSNSSERCESPIETNIDYETTSNLNRARLAQFRMDSQMSQSPPKTEHKSVKLAEEISIHSGARSNNSIIHEIMEYQPPEANNRTFYSEIHNLQGTVDEVKRTQNGLWESSATSLERLQVFQKEQQRQLEQTVVDQRAAEHRAEEANIELRRQVEESRCVRQQYEKEIEDIKAALDRTIIERSSVEKIADEAVLSQARTEEELRMFKEELSRAKRHMQQLAVNVDNLTQDRAQLMAELKASEKKATTISSENNKYDIKISELENQIKNFENERTTLMEKLENSSNTATKLMSENVKLGELRTQLDFMIQEMQRWKNACHEMKAILSKQQSEVSQSSEIKDAEVRRLDMEVARLNQDLNASRHELNDMKAEYDRRYDVAKRELISSSNQVVHEREQVGRLRDELKLSRDTNNELKQQAERSSNLILARNDEIKQLQVILKTTKNERDQARKHISTMKEAVETFQTGTKERVAKIVGEKRSLETALQTALNNSKVSEEANSRLAGSLEQCQREKSTLQITVAALQKQTEEQETQRAKIEGEKRDLAYRVGQLESTIECMRRDLEVTNHNQTKADRSDQYDERASHRPTDVERDRHRSRNGHLRSFVDDPDEAYIAELSLGSQRIQRLERDSEQLRSQFESKLNIGSGVSMETFRAERARRVQAEELTAIISARAKQAFEDRNDEIIRLKLRLSSVVDEKENEIRNLRSRLFDMEKQQIARNPARSRRDHSNTSNGESYWGSNN